MMDEKTILKEIESYGLPIGFLQSRKKGTRLEQIKYKLNRVRRHKRFLSQHNMQHHTPRIIKGKAKNICHTCPINASCKHVSENMSSCDILNQLRSKR